MGTNLSGTKIKDTYTTILKVDGGIDGTLKTVSDGDGTDSSLKISNSGIETGTVTTTGTLTVGDGSTPSSYTPSSLSDGLVVQSGNSTTGITLVSGATSTSNIVMGDNGQVTGSTPSGGVIQFDSSTNLINISNGNNTGISINDSGAVSIVKTDFTEQTTAVTANILETADLVIFTGTAANQTLTLPSSANSTGKVITIINQNTQPIDVTSASNINAGVNKFVMAGAAANGAFNNLKVVSRGNNGWQHIEKSSGVTHAGRS